MRLCRIIYACSLWITVRNSCLNLYSFSVSSLYSLMTRYKIWSFCFYGWYLLFCWVLSVYTLYIGFSNNLKKIVYDYHWFRFSFQMFSARPCPICFICNFFCLFLNVSPLLFWQRPIMNPSSDLFIHYNKYHEKSGFHIFCHLICCD